MNGNDPRNSRSSADRVRSAAGDIRALGVGAPLRAAYEASKRFGGHTLIFGHLVPTTAAIVTGRSPFTIRTVPESVHERTIAQADRIVDGTIELFGQDLHLGDSPSWHAVIHNEESWPGVDWWRIDLRSDERLGDVKWTWELGRHRHLVILARAAHLEPSVGRYLEVLDQHLESWIEANPPEIGVHWYSNLEIALRSISWLQILALVDDRLQPDVRAGMWRHLRHAGRHLFADLPYTVSTMRNNHLLGDALGLVALGRAFGGKTGQRWASIGSRIFSRQLGRHMRRDGSMIEDSVSYHRFVLEMLSMRVVLGGATGDVHDAMEQAAQFFARLGVLDGSVPQYGDWDEGRVFAVSENPADLAGSVRLALALAGDGAPNDWRDTCDEVAWFTDQGTPVAPEPAETGGTDIGAGIARAAVGPYTVWLKGGSGPSHGHADLSSVAIALEGAWIVGDPGTGTYNGPLHERNYFRGSQSHDVVRVDGEDQLVPHRAFRWVHQATGIIGAPIRIGDTVVLWAVHDAYTRLSPPRRVVRVVAVSADAVEISDHVEGSPASIDLALPLHPLASWDSTSSMVQVDCGAIHLELPVSDVEVAFGSAEPYAGWWSETYGTSRPATVLQMRLDTSQSIRWMIDGRDGLSPDVRPKDLGTVATTVLFDEAGVRLRLEVDGRTFLRSI